jgi:restriction system protein
MSLRYSVEIRHPGLGKYRVITGTDEGVVKAKARAQLLQWEHQYKLAIEKARVQAEKVSKKMEEAEKKQEAFERTAEAQSAIDQVNRTLEATLSVNDAIDWETLKNQEAFPKKEPLPPVYGEYPPEPQPNAPEFQPILTLLDKLSKSRVEKKQADAQLLFDQAYARWAQTVEAIKAEDDRLYNEQVAALEAWNAERLEYEANQIAQNDAIEQRKAAYLSADPEAITDYCELVLSRSAYPESFPKDFQLEYNPETRILVVEYSLPAPEHLPRLKEVKYVKSKDDFTEVLLPEVEQNRMYDDVLYQICLRTIHELFEADVINALAAVVFNGWVRSIDKATGKEANGCVISVQVKKEALQEIDLANIDPRTCFKSLKGVGSSKLHSLTPVPPVLQISREDKRFVPSHEVANQLDDRFNLAAMDWEDFEHLIRELFEKEFKQTGGEVKITQASRDGGVDAVAFDPDPIRGGKIVIQAKRYTNTVGVSAVRDLFGTVMNEGATKGILVTTSDYGPDAYEFAKAKPLTLLNGGNLLHLLEKHGHKAKIDLKEAKQILAQEHST